MGRYVLLLAVLVGVTLFAIPNARQAAAINLWSVRYAAEVHNLPRSQAALPLPPDGHPRATLWRAIRALNNSDGRTALALSERLTTEEDRTGLQIMARAYELLGDFSAATEIWKETGNSDALLRVADSATEAGYLDEALEAYYAAWELDPLEGTDKLASFLERELDDVAAAEAVLLQSLASYRSSRGRPYWLRCLVSILEAQNRWSEAAEAYQQLILAYPLLYPGDRKISRDYYEMAWAYHMSGQAQEAIAAVEQALKLNPDHPKKMPRSDLLRRAGQIYEFAGETEKALASYRQVLILRPNDKTAQEALERLTGDQ